jgi:hypothetical protein
LCTVHVPYRLVILAQTLRALFAVTWEDQLKA